jgi:hypothetical protein
MGKENGAFKREGEGNRVEGNRVSVVVFGETDGILRFGEIDRIAILIVLQVGNEDLSDLFGGMK